MKKDIFKNNKGSAFVLVIIMIPVLMILGMTLLNTSLFEVKQASIQEKKLQAYYIAWSGADATGNWIIQNNGPGRLLDETSKWTPLPDIEKGEFKVEVSGTVDEIEIVATGEVDGVEEIATLLLKSSGGGPPTPIDDVVEAKTGVLNWLNGSSHIMSKNSQNGEIRSSKVPVRFTLADNNNKEVTLTPNSEAELMAPAMYFDTALLIRHSNNNRTKLILHAETIVFRDKVTIENGGSLTLFVPDEEGLSSGRDGSTIKGGVEGIKYGRVYFVEGVEITERNNGNREQMIPQKRAYYFPNGVTLQEYELKYPETIGLIPIGGYEKTWK